MKRVMAIILSIAVCSTFVFTNQGAADSPYGAYLPLVDYSSSLNVWTISPATKVQPTTLPGTQKSITLEGARQSYASYQIIVTASSALTNVNLTASSLSDNAGHSLLASNLTFFCEVFIDYTGVVESEPGSQPVPKNSPTHDGRVPDPLIPFFDPYTPGRGVGAPFDVGTGQNQPVWLDIYIPAGTPPGVYNGMITATANLETPVIIPIALTVWNLTLPDMNSITTHFTMHTDEAITNYHGGTSACSGSSCYLDWNKPKARTIVKRYEELLHDSRISVEPNFVYDPQGTSCVPPSDWSTYDAAMQPYLDGSYWNDGVPSSWIPTPFTPGANWGIDANCTKAQYRAIGSAWSSHLKAKGWFNKAIAYALDEPDSSSFPAIAAQSSVLQSSDPAWKAHIMDTTAPKPSNVGILNPALGIYTVPPSGYDRWGLDPTTPAANIPYGRSNWPSLFAQGIQLWFYESIAQGAPYPTFAVNTLLGYEPLILLWGSWYEKATGFLYWDTTAWTANSPWGQNIAWGKSGDGVLLYPGNHDGALSPIGSPAGVSIDGPVPSYRLKMVRQGLQDWALFRLADQHGLTAYAQSQVATVYGQMGGCEWQGCPPKLNGQFFWITDEALVQQVRHNIAMAIVNAP